MCRAEKGRTAMRLAWDSPYFVIHLWWCDFRSYGDQAPASRLCALPAVSPVNDFVRIVLTPSAQRKRTSTVAKPKIFRPADFAATSTTPVRVVGSSDLTRPLNSMSAPSAADTIAGEDSRTE